MEGSHSHFPAVLGSSHFPVPTPGCKVGEDSFGAPVWSLEETFNSSIPGPYLQEVLIHLEGWDEAESREVIGATLISLAPIQPLHRLPEVPQQGGPRHLRWHKSWQLGETRVASVYLMEHLPQCCASFLNIKIRGRLGRGPLSSKGHPPAALSLGCPGHQGY